MFQDRISRSQADYHRILSDAAACEHEIAVALTELQRLRNCVLECFGAASKAIDARGPNVSGTPIYMPKSLCK